MKRRLFKKVSRAVLKLNVLLGTLMLSLYAWADDEDIGSANLGTAATHMKSETDQLKIFALGAAQVVGIGIFTMGVMEIYGASKGSPTHKMSSGIVKLFAGGIAYFLPRFMGMAAGSIFPTGA